MLVDRERAFDSPFRDSARTALRPEIRRVFFFCGFAPHPFDAWGLGRVPVQLIGHPGMPIFATELAP